MNEALQEVVQQAYERFNNRDIDGVLSLMQPGVVWPNGWEGGVIEGKEAIRNYWKRQWKTLDPVVTPMAYKDKSQNEVEVKVDQLVKDLQGNLLAHDLVRHVFTFQDGMISKMEIKGAI